MFDNSRIGLYEYLYDLFYGVVMDNVYSISEPQELTESDVQDGFIVIKIDTMLDNSEFDREAYGQVRCNVYVYVPPISRGRLDFDKYKEFEDAVNNVIENARFDRNLKYLVEDGNTLSSDTFEITNADNTFFMFIKSFIVTISNFN